MVAILEGIARQIGTSIDDKWEALLYIMFKGRAAEYACSLSEYAQDVFNVVCTVT
jgi:hypothetical protein